MSVGPSLRSLETGVVSYDCPPSLLVGHNHLQTIDMGLTLDLAKSNRIVFLTICIREGAALTTTEQKMMVRALILLIAPVTTVFSIPRSGLNDSAQEEKAIQTLREETFGDSNDGFAPFRE